MPGENSAAAAAVAANYARIAKAVRTGAESALLQIGIQAVNEIKLMLSEGGSGRTYQRGGVSHAASAPGQPPAVDTGRLRSSITHTVGDVGGEPYVEVGTNVEYASYLEYGTSRMAPRPFLRPAIEKLVTTIGDAVAKAVLDAEESA